MITSTIPLTSLARLKDEIATINRKAERLSLPPLRLALMPAPSTFEYARTDELQLGPKYEVKRVLVEVLGEVPRLNGWQLIGRKEALPDGAALYSCIPGLSIPSTHRNEDCASCSHCGMDRNRKAVHIVQHEDGRSAQVGRQCLADFVGSASVEGLLAAAEMGFAVSRLFEEAEDEDFGCGGGSGYWACPMDRFLAVTAAIVRKFGWCSRGKAEAEQRTSSASLVLERLIGKAPWCKEVHVEEQDLLRGRNALEWARSITGDSDYEINLRAACQQEVVVQSTVGLVASAVSGYQRHLDRLAEQAQRANLHVGTVGERSGFTGLLVRSMKPYEGHYGVKTLVTFHDASGNVIIWWATSKVDWLQEGQVYDVTGTVKAHGDYRGTKQTELSRVSQGLPKVKKPKKIKI